MKRLLAVFVVVLWPFGSMAGSALDDCNHALREFSVFIGAGFQRTNTSVAARLEDGSCSFQGTSDPIAFRSGTFLLQEPAEASAEGRSINFALEQVVTPLGAIDLSGTVHQDVLSGQLVLERLVALRDDTIIVRASADLFLLSAGQVPTARDLAVNGIRMHVRVSPDLLRTLDWNYREITGFAIDRVLKDVSRTQIDNPTRSAFLRLAQAAPNAQGTLEVELAFEAYIDVLQVIVMIAETNEEELVSALSEAYPDATLRISWKPGRI